MNAVHLVAGLVVAGLVVVGLVVLETHMPPDAQRLLVKNDFADANCKMQFNSGEEETFSLRKGGEYRKTYKAPQIGFINMSCRAAGRIIDAPGSFHMMSYAEARIAINEAGMVDFRLVKDQPAAQPSS